MRHLPALLVLIACAPLPALAQDVTVYRCGGKDGAVTLRDSPCLPGETQQIRSMVRPKDAPPPQFAAPPDAAPAPPRETVVVRSTAQPMYECTNVETGAVYTSDDDSGNPRWINVPGVVWLPGAPTYAPPPGAPPARSTLPLQGSSPGNGITIVQSRPPHPPPPSGPPAFGGVYVPADSRQMIRDTCHVLPQAETCARLNDRKYAILKRWNSASQGEQHALGREQRGLLARMENDCGNF